MQPLESREFFATSSCPVPAGMGSFEIWGEPLVQLLLEEFRFIDASDGFVCE